jgi:hypothetical protein
MNALPGLEKYFIFGVYIPDPPLVEFLSLEVAVAVRLN